MLASFTAFSSDLLTSLDFKNKEKKQPMLPYGLSNEQFITQSCKLQLHVLSILGCTILCTLHTHNDSSLNRSCQHVPYHCDNESILEGHLKGSFLEGLSQRVCLRGSVLEVLSKSVCLRGSAFEGLSQGVLSLRICL